MYKRKGNYAVSVSSGGVYTFEVMGADRSKLTPNNFFSPFANLTEHDGLQVGKFRIIPYGQNNNLPAEIRSIIDENNLAEGIFKRQRGLLWGQGPALYTEEFIDGKKVKKFLHDPEIESWLKSWNYIKYLQKVVVDYMHAESHFTKVIRNRGPRVGKKGKILKLEHISVNNCRLEFPDKKGFVNHIIQGNWEMPNVCEFKRFPVYDEFDAFKFPVAMHYANIASFARNFYSSPSYFGALNWIKRSSSIPKILESLADNMLTVKFHIKTPAAYWEQQESKLNENCTNEGKQYKPEMLDELKDATFKKLTSVLTGEQNVGKFFSSEFITNEFGKLEGWEIEPIDLKVKDYIDSQIKVSEKADSATTSGIGLHPSLSNLVVDGKLASGSEQLYALKLYLATEIDLPESIVMEAVNYAIEANFPNKQGIKLGFYHDVVKTEDNVSPKERVKNAV